MGTGCMWFKIWLFFGVAFGPALCEVFTAMADMEALLHSEQNIVDVIDDYVRAETQRLKQLKEVALHYETRNRRYADDGIEVIANPVNTFLIIKRLTSEWSQVESLMRTNTADDFISNITAARAQRQVRFPGYEDLSGAATALLRLQDTYRLNTADIAAGNIVGAKQAQELTAHDCFELGRVAYNDNDYYHTLLWMQESMNRLEHENPPTAKQADVLEYLAYAMYQQGNVKRAYTLTKQLYDVDPNHPRVLGNLQYYEDQIAANAKKGINEGAFQTLDNDDIKNLRPNTEEETPETLSEREMYESLCRGEHAVDPTRDPTMFCYYKRDRPFLKMAPLKVEVVHRRPTIIILRQIIADDEIATVKEMALPRLQRATVQNSVTGQLETATYRISKSAWLKNEENPTIKTISNRLDYATNLNMDTAEELQVANYGIGGHYDPHFDFARKEEKNAFKDLNSGNRIATVLFYMSQPEAGGATVFPELRVALFPSKNDAAFWHNLLPSGEGDMRTRHAACPVLSGIKWVSNKWLHEYGQEFRRPCDPNEFLDD